MFHGGDVDVQKYVMVMITMSKMFNVNDVAIQNCAMVVMTMFKNV
jgi:hypothetical protein